MCWLCAPHSSPLGRRRAEDAVFGQVADRQVQLRPIPQRFDVAVRRHVLLAVDPDGLQEQPRAVDPGLRFDEPRLGQRLGPDQARLGARRPQRPLRFEVDFVRFHGGHLALDLRLLQVLLATVAFVLDLCLTNERIRTELQRSENPVQSYP